jgi:hypothetical protein
MAFAIAFLQRLRSRTMPANQASGFAGDFPSRAGFDQALVSIGGTKRPEAGNWSGGRR